MGHSQVGGQALPPLCRFQAEMAVVGSQQGLPCGSISTVTMGQEPVVDGLSASPHSIQISHPSRQGSSTYEVILSDHPQQSTEDAVKPMKPAVALCCMSPWASASTSCLIPIEVGWGIIKATSENWEKYTIVDTNLPECEGRFGGMTTQAVVSDFDDPTWHWRESPAKVRSDFVGEQSQIHFMSISVHWKHRNSIHNDFIASNRV